MENREKQIDGSRGEGGGQVLRSCLSLSILTQTPVEITNIRAGRARPGLAAQHLTAIEAAAQISQAEVEGASLGSSWLRFRPGRVQPGVHHFRIGTAGSTTLVLQTVLPPLLIAHGRSRITVEGGTHNPLAPCFEFLDRAFLPLLCRLGPVANLTLERYGFQPAGGGKFTFEVQPHQTWKGLDIRERGPLRYQRARALVANLPIKIANRECAALQAPCHWKKDCFQAESVPAKGPGNILMVELGFEQVCELFAQPGAVHRSSERIAQDLWTEVKEYLDQDAPIGPHLADQILLPMAMAAIHGNPSAFVTGPLTRHTTTQVELLPEFLPIKVEIIPQANRGNLVRLERS